MGILAHHAPVQRDLTDEDDGFEFNQAGSAKKDDDHHWDFGGVQTEHKTQHEDHFGICLSQKREINQFSSQQLISKTKQLAMRRRK